MNTLTLPQFKESEELTKILALLTLKLQKDFDLSVKALHALLLRPEFLTQTQFLREQTYQSMLRQIRQYKKTQEEEDLPSVPSSSQYCGHLLKVHANGYHQYCNVHQYLHDRDEQDHSFTPKDEEILQKEEYDQTIFQIYRDYLNRLFMQVHRLLYYWIKQNCSPKMYLLEELDWITQQLKEIPEMFRSRYVYKKDNTYQIRIYKLPSNINIDDTSGSIRTQPFSD